MLTAKRGWLVIGVVTVVYEIICPEGQLLSEGVDRAILKHPLSVRALIMFIAFHLVNWLPVRVDPLHWLAVGVAHVRGTQHEKLESAVFE